MNKKLRHEMKLKFYKRRLKRLGYYSSQTINQPKGVYENGVEYNFTALRSHSTPCSCYCCSHRKYNRAKVKANYPDAFQNYEKGFAGDK